MKKTYIIVMCLTLSLVNATDFLPLPKDFQRYPQLYINKIDIDAELCGLLMKSMIEIEFHNPYDRDSLETNLQFFSNSHSFIRELWLDINGKYKISENLSRSTGTKIYNKITKVQRKDPALLTLMEDGKFNLNVYPFLKGQSRKVKIEMYSILKQNNDTLKWDFSTGFFKNEFDINLTVKCKLPKISYSVINNKNIRIENDALNATYKNKAELRLIIPVRNEKILINNYRTVGMNYLLTTVINDYKYMWDLNNVKNQLPKDVIYLPKELNGIELLKYLLDNVNNENKRGYSTCIMNNSIKRFINYLKSKKGAKITTYFNEKMLWRDLEGRLELVRIVSKEDLKYQDLILFPYEKDSVYTTEIVCDYLNCFIEFAKINNADIIDQIKSGYLTMATSKLVLEDSESVNLIKEQYKKLDMIYKKKIQHLETPPAKLYLDNNSQKLNTESLDLEVVNTDMEICMLPPKPPVKVEEEIHDYFPIKEKPIMLPESMHLIKNYIQKYYPDEAKDKLISGNVFLKFICSKEGVAENVTVTKERPANMGFGEVAVNAIKLYGRFTPGMVRGKVVLVRMNQQKIEFKANSTKNDITEIDYSDYIKSHKNLVYLGRKKFTINLPDTPDRPLLVEIGYKNEKYQRIKYKSDDYYEMLFKHPDLLDSIWTQPDILFKYKEKWYRIVP